MVQFVVGYIILNYVVLMAHKKNIWKLHMPVPKLLQIYFHLQEI